ncbi:MAG: hypothetical protein PUB21_07980 [Bacteroidales bacterium]|nr:hypothetical protein [Bacteroidales bacterium]
MTTTKYNRSEIMKRAWEIYRKEGKERVTVIGCVKLREPGKSFSSCLKQAWREAKAANSPRKAVVYGSFDFPKIMQSDLINYYSNSMYNGD